MEDNPNDLRAFFSVIIGLISGAGVVLLGLFLTALFSSYTAQKNFLIVIIILSFVLALLIAKRAFELGILNFLAALIATKKLDFIVPEKNADATLSTAEEFVQLFSNGQIKSAKGFIKIWGDWKRRTLEEENEIKDIFFEASSQKLTIGFSKFNASLTIIGPSKILASKTSIRIQKAKEIRWEWKTGRVKSPYFFHYKKEGRKIKTSTNCRWDNWNTFTSTGEPALLLLKKY